MLVHTYVGVDSMMFDGCRSHSRSSVVFSLQSLESGGLRVYAGPESHQLVASNHPSTLWFRALSVVRTGQEADEIVEFRSTFSIIHKAQIH